MMRVVVESLVVFLLPSLLYVLYVVFNHQRPWLIAGLTGVFGAELHRRGVDPYVTALFLLPIFGQVIYVLVKQPDLLKGAPLLYLFGAGAALTVAGLAVVHFGSNSGDVPERRYVPPTMKDGRIQPGHIE